MKLPTAASYEANVVCQTTTDYSPFAASNQVNCKYPPLYYPSLGSAVVLIMLWEVLQNVLILQRVSLVLKVSLMTMLTMEVIPRGLKLVR